VANRRSKRPKSPNARLERSLAADGFQLVAGLDEVGRGAWAGPVSVGAVVHSFAKRPPVGIRDSKQLSEPQREDLFPKVATWCTEWAVGHASPQECDAHGMTRALRLAAQRALAQLSVEPEVVLLDGNFDYVTEPESHPDAALFSIADGPATSTDRAAARQPDSADAPRRTDAPKRATPIIRTVVKGDTTCLSIAAASILAKVTRDRMMRSWSDSFPPFDFDRNKGYPSPSHRTALSGFGLTSIHRRSWSFVDDMAFR
jgi:ribonuclease HII